MPTATTEIGVGAQAPGFARDTANGAVALEHYRGRQHVVLYFMRTFDCPVCLGHVMRLARTSEQFAAQNTALLIIGPGDEHEAARLQGKVPFPVIADPQLELYTAYGLGKVLGVQQSGTILVDRSGSVRYINRVTVPFGALKEQALWAAIGEAQAGGDTS